MVYVSESHNRRVSIFTSDGQFVTSFGRNGRGPGEFVMTHGLAVDDCGVVYNYPARACAARGKVISRGWVVGVGHARFC